MRLGFAKYEGLGNDFIVVDASDPRAVDAELARRLCDRHFGIGGDGVLLVLPPRSNGSRATMLVLNADGSQPEMCGNGVRCVALHLARRDGATGASYVVDTGAGPLLCEVDRNGDGGFVRTSMGKGRREGEHRAEHAGKNLIFTRISLGNPHAVAFDAELSLEAIDELGPRISAALPGGANVEFAKLEGPRAFELVVWERGVGRTLACGTGAAATVVAAALSGRAPFGEPVNVRLPGGVLEINVSRDDLEVHQRGPARLVFTGELE
jgi:diaminopimelate epimerase